jgi:hypothetical protein
MRTLLANPADMIAQGAPRVIHNDRELAMYTKALIQLTSWRILLTLKRTQSSFSRCL